MTNEQKTAIQDMLNKIATEARNQLICSSHFRKNSAAYADSKMNYAMCKIRIDDIVKTLHILGIETEEANYSNGVYDTIIK